ncbi:MAG: hybrid sensor histidine kinase/response regulator [Alphaproteobacteria bacterium]|nr:hybrid sensor histidine kinase/response regulator [Alphaproteobacteria bacterium]
MENNGISAHRPAKLLIVDDNENARSLLKRRLAMYGHEVMSAANQSDALKVLRDNPVDVIFLNMFLDNQNSSAFLQKLKSNDSYQNIPIIMISSNDDTELLVKCIEAGAEDYLVKPLNQTILRARLSNCIARKEAYDKELQYIAQIKQGQKQIAAQEKMASVGVLATSISNELKNPLNFVINFANVSAETCSELIKDLESQNLFTEETQRKILSNLRKFQSNVSKISNYGRNADQIIRFMLDQSNTDSSQKHPANVNKIIEQTINMLMSSYKSKGTTNLPRIITDFPKNVPHIVLSVQAFSKVIYNILDNAFYSLQKKYPDPTLSEVMISVKNNLTDIEIIIKDNGLGISSEIKNKIFEPFFTTKTGGMNPGLGLSTALEIIQDLKGSISVDSLEGEFAEFKITIPQK